VSVCVPLLCTLQSLSCDSYLVDNKDEWTIIRSVILTVECSLDEQFLRMNWAVLDWIMFLSAVFSLLGG